MTALLEHDNNYVTAKIYNYNLYKCTENGKNIHTHKNLLKQSTGWKTVQQYVT